MVQPNSSREKKPTILAVLAFLVSCGAVLAALRSNDVAQQANDIAQQALDVQTKKALSAWVRFPSTEQVKVHLQNSSTNAPVVVSDVSVESKQLGLEAVQMDAPGEGHKRIGAGETVVWTLDLPDKSNAKLVAAEIKSEVEDKDKRVETPVQVAISVKLVNNGETQKFSQTVVAEVGGNPSWWSDQLQLIENSERL